MIKIRKILKKNQKGFTLVELIVVIAILGILALIAVPRFVGTMNNAKVKTDVATARTIVSAVALAQTEGVTFTTANQPTVAELVSNGYLNEAPESAQNSAAFTIAYGTDDAITSITVTGADTDTVYPAP